MTDTPQHTSDIQAMHDELGIPAGYAHTCGLEFQPDCQQLVPTEPDIYGRQPFLDAAAFAAWQAMQAKALVDGVQLQIISAYRSADYQCGLLRKKMTAGRSITELLKVNAAPGYSEHHSGCALDITTPGYPPLEEVFEESPAFAWLQNHAGNFGFSLSFPRDNSAGMTYEPWHWKFRRRA